MMVTVDIIDQVTALGTVLVTFCLAPIVITLQMAKLMFRKGLATSKCQNQYSNSHSRAHTFFISAS